MEIKVLSLVVGYFGVRIGVLGKVTAIPILLRKRLNVVKDIFETCVDQVTNELLPVLHYFQLNNGV